MNQNPSDQLSILLPLSFECLCFKICLESNLNPTKKLLYTRKIFGLTLLFCLFVQTSQLHQVSVAQCLGQQTAVAKVASSKHSGFFHVTPRCLLVQYCLRETRDERQETRYMKGAGYWLSVVVGRSLGGGWRL